MGKNENMDRSCPACDSLRVIEIPEEEKTYGIGLYEIYDFVGGLDKIFKTYRCSSCGYEW